jgi:WD40 repeat protein
VAQYGRRWSGGSAKLWDAESGELVFDPISHERAMMAIDFSPDGCYVAVHVGDDGVHVFDVATAESVWQLEGIIFGVGLTFSPDGSKVAASSDSICKSG